MMKMLSLNRKGKYLVNVSDKTKNQRRENDKIEPNLWRASKPLQKKVNKDRITRTKDSATKL